MISFFRLACAFRRAATLAALIVFLVAQVANGNDRDLESRRRTDRTRDRVEAMAPRPTTDAQGRGSLRNHPSAHPARSLESESGRPSHPTRLIVKPRKHVRDDTLRTHFGRQRLREHRKLRRSRTRVVQKLDDAQSMDTLIRELRESGNYEYVERDFLVSASETIPNDPRFGELWGLRNVGQQMTYPCYDPELGEVVDCDGSGSAGSDTRATTAWDDHTGDTQPGQVPVVVGVVDSGIDYTHEDLAANMWRNPGEIAGNGIDDDGNGYVDDVHGIDCIDDSGDPFDDNRHGTHVAGTIAGVADNGKGIAGVSWQAELMALKFLDHEGYGYVSDAVQCLEYATEMRSAHQVNVRVTNNSWGGNGHSQALLDAIEDAGREGILFVAAAGNSGRDTDVHATAPASFDSQYIVSVAATNWDDELAWFSNYGTRSVDLAAPGVTILSSVPGDGYEFLNGTSMAAPHVSGAAARLFAGKPWANPLPMKALLMESGEAIPGLASLVGSGKRLDVAAADCDFGDTALVLDVGEAPIPGEDVVVRAIVTDCLLPVLSATVTLQPSGGAAISLRDDGHGADTVAADGSYAGVWRAGPPGATTLSATAIFSGGFAQGSLDVAVYEPSVDYAVSEVPFEWVDTPSGRSVHTTYDNYPWSSDPGAICDNGDPGYPPFEFALNYHLGFPFPYYDEVYDQIFLTHYGHVLLTQYNLLEIGEPESASLPLNLRPNAVVAPFWDVLPDSREICYGIQLDGEAPARRYTLTWWHRVSNAPMGFGVREYFQLSLYEFDGRIVFRYRDLDFGDPAIDGGAGATIGIEGPRGLFGTQFAHGGADLDGGTALEFRRVGSACSDGVDNDGDGLVDYPEDPGCRSAAWREDPACSNGLDDDGDGLVDFPHDPGCASASSHTESPACSDGVNNDIWDGIVDYPNDPECDSPSDPSEHHACFDGLDNDGDGVLDSEDPGCGNRSYIVNNQYSGGWNPEDGDDVLDGSERSYTVVCDDGVDNDGDGVADYPDDPGCFGPHDGDERSSTVACDDGVDNDGDGAADFPADDGCPSPTGSTESPACADGLDNDGDGRTDAPLDYGCDDRFDSSERSDAFVCDDGIDNDGDGLTDFPADPSCTTVISGAEETACSDGVDNDGDGLTDHPADPSCLNAGGTHENTACSDGVDNDQDGSADYPHDGGCTTLSDTSESQVGRVCDDGLDNDGDGLVDAANDPGCENADDSSEQSSAIACDDGVDNDGDGLADAQDPGCDDAEDPSERGAPICDDGLDNDDDGLVDYPADPGCASPSALTEQPACGDGIDNDGDGRIDGEDAGCEDDLDPSERSPALPCDDGLDSDGDTLTDWPADPGCSSPDDDSERGPGAVCDDGIDQDDDGFADFPADPGCSSRSDSDEQSAALPCDDGLDNDGDNAFDWRPDPMGGGAPPPPPGPGGPGGPGGGSEFDPMAGDMDCSSLLDESEAFEPPVVPDCQDGLDNDGDGLLDYPADDGCHDWSDSTETQDTTCQDGLDNDGDELVDWPEDYGCTSAGDPTETDDAAWVVACSDGWDNDGDGLVDYPEDPGCSVWDDDSERGLGLTCDDGLDADGDGHADHPEDPGCESATDVSERAPHRVCDDGRDNDGDGAVDEGDERCAGSEGRPATRCGLGFEVVLLLPGLRWLRRRRGTIR